MGSCENHASALRSLPASTPPESTSPAGVHVEYLARELARLCEITVHAWGEARPAGAQPPVVAHRAWGELSGTAPELAALQAMSIDLRMAALTQGVDLVHSHTWYANLGGHLASSCGTCRTS